MFSRLGFSELLILFAILLLLFGAKRVPEVAESLGKALRKFRASSSTGEEKKTPPL